MSSTVSCSSAAHSVSVSRRMPAQMRATPTGCTMKSSPDLRRCAAWCSQANTNASCTRARSISTAESGGVLGDDREQIAEQSALELVQIQLRLRRAAAMGLTAACSAPLGLAWISGISCRPVLSQPQPSTDSWILCDRHAHRVGDDPPGLKRLGGASASARTARAPRPPGGRSGSAHRPLERPAAAGRAWRSTRRGSLTPFHSLTSSVNVASAGSPSLHRQASARPERDRRARGRRAIRTVKRDMLAFPHRPHVAERGVRDQQRHARVAPAERSQPLQLLRQSHPQLVTSHHGVHSLHRDHVRPASSTRSA